MTPRASRPPAARTVSAHGGWTRELDDEVRAHLELAERDALASGLSPEEARRIARRRFGSIDG